EEVGCAVGEGGGLAGGIAVDQRRVRLDVVDDRQRHFGEAGALEDLHETRFDTPSPRCLFDQQRPYAGGISQFDSHQQKTSSPRSEKRSLLPGWFALARPSSDRGAVHPCVRNGG